MGLEVKDGIIRLSGKSEVNLFCGEDDKASKDNPAFIISDTGNLLDFIYLLTNSFHWCV